MGDLCTACMCNGRKLYYIGETELYHLFTQILNEIHVYDSSPFYIRVCWECAAHLRSWLRFKQQAKRCYTQLQYVQQNNFVQEPQPPHLAISHVYNFCYPEPSVDLKIKIETEEIELRENETHAGDGEPERDRLQDVKTEEMHCEPETFVNNLNLEPKKKRGRKVDKPIKEKPKKKVKPKTDKIPVEKKIKVKKKERSPSLDSIQDDHVDAQEFEEDGEVEDIVPEKKEEENDDMPLLKEITRLNGTSKVEGGREGPEKEPALPERPHCEECGKNFSSRKTYRYHLNVLHKGQNRYPCPRCGKVYQWKSNLGRHLRSHKARDSGELYCETCDKRFASVATYRQHLRVSRRHVPESDFSFMCNECGKKFVNKTRLRDHIDWEHLKKIKFRCQLCNKPFKCHTSLYVHLQNVHHNKEKKDNLCHVCGKSYQNAAKLKYHIVAMHTSETPYQCQHCTAAFGWYSSLYRHVREVHYKLKLQPRKTKKVRKEDIHPSLLPPPTPPPHALPHSLPHSSRATPHLSAPP